MMKGRKRPHTQGRPGRAWSDGGGGEGAEADMPSRCETVPSQSQLGIQTHEPKVILSSMLDTHDNGMTGVRCLNGLLVFELHTRNL